jgi:hypothetical protein
MPLLALDPRSDALLPLERAPLPVARGSHGGRSVFVTHADDDDATDGDPPASDDASAPEDPAAELAGVARDLAKQRAAADASADAKAGVDAFARACAWPLLC